MIKKIKIYFILAFLLSFSSFYYLYKGDIQTRIDHELENNLKDLEVHYSLTMDYFYTDAKSIHANMLLDSKLTEALKNAYGKPSKEQAKIRKELFDHLLPQYKNIHSRGILQFHFVFPDNVTFLRVHKPKKFGDNLSKVRYSYKYVNDTKKIVKGFEQGKTVHAIRYVFPLFDKDKQHVGAGEISLSTKYLQDKLEKSNKLHTHYIVDKKIFEVKVWKEPGMAEKYIQSVESDDYMYTLTSHNYDKELRKIEDNYMASKRALIKEKMKQQTPFSIYIPRDDVTTVVSFLPIRNIKDKKVVAYLVSHKDNETIYNIIHDSYKVLTGAFFLFLFVFYYMYQTITNKDKLKQEVDEKTKELQNLNENLEKRIKNEVKKNQQAQEQIFKSEKLAAMGEMIGNIAHQWRQPLSVVSTAATGLKVHKEFGTLTDDIFCKSCDSINDNAQYLSKTIDDFRNFIKGNRTKVDFDISQNVNSFLHLVEGSIKNHSIKVVKNIEDVKISGYPNELVQCYINIFNNSKDAFKKGQDQRYLFIDIHKNNDSLTISLKDNGGGIDEDILPHIFEPYFTTKHQSQGTGLGLHMTYNLITSGMHGTIEANNVTYEYEGEKLSGAQFNIKLPL